MVVSRKPSFDGIMNSVLETMGMGKIWGVLGTAMASIIFVNKMYEQLFPRSIRIHINRLIRRVRDRVCSYVHVSFSEFTGDRYFDKTRSEAYIAIQTYLSVNSTQNSKSLRAELVKDSQTLVLGIDDDVEVADKFQGYTVWWISTNTSKSCDRTGRILTLIFHERYRAFITGTYIQHVLREGRAIALRNRTLKLYTNNSSNDWYSHKNTKWSHLDFEHPSRFETLAMDPRKKEEILNDLHEFKNGKEYYYTIGKPWKRGYLLYGPPGTGKSSMIAAMANFMNYDIYDLELTAVKENTELRRLLIDTSSKSIIVIEDIDCSLDLTGQRKKLEKDKVDKNEDQKNRKLTLSGLLNFIDGIWSACGGERIIVFTTNFVEKLDPALIRRGRMDMHIEMSYCGYEAFKVLAKNYLKLDSHTLFPIIEDLLGETNITPADVAENLIPKLTNAEDNDSAAETCLKTLILSLEETKKKAQDREEKIKAKQDKEARLKEQRFSQEEEVKAIMENLVVEGVKKINKLSSIH